MSGWNKTRIGTVLENIIASLTYRNSFTNERGLGVHLSGIVGQGEDELVTTGRYELNLLLQKPYLFKVVGGLSGTVDANAHVILASGEETTILAKDLHENNAKVLKVFDDTALTLTDFYLWR